MISPDHESAPDGASLPLPQRTTRWQPLRSGVLNLYRYDYEEFHFEDGRLLLRGNNGSGKSRVLALQLPFLLDGETSPARVEPDGDQAKRIEWNLLMGRYPDRTGYTWIEFGRREEDGTPRFLTLGCGLRAVAGHTGLHSRWFFITSQRIGRDLFLQNVQRTPLGREKLEAAIGGAGRVIPKAEDYRRAVDEALFGLGPRFGPLIELLLRLRRPQLSRKLEEEELSNALSEALPTLPSSMIEVVAESFSGLQTDRSTLREFVAAGEAVSAFLGEYSGYMRIAVRRRANAVRTTHAAYEAAQRAVREAERRLAAATEQLAALGRMQAELETQLAGAESVERTLREGPEMKTAEEVRLAGEAAKMAADAFAQSQIDEQRAANVVHRAQQQQQRVRQDAVQIEAELEQKRHAVDAAAFAADLAPAHRREMGELDAPIAGLEFSPTRETALRTAVEQRERALVTLRKHEQKVAAAQAAFHAADTARLQAEAAASAAREAEHGARQALAQAGATLMDDYARWSAGVRQLQPPAAEALSDSFASWLEQRDGASPLRIGIDAAYRATVDRFAGRESALVQRQTQLSAEIADLATAIAQLEQGETPPPPPPPFLRAERRGRSGAPLWKLCDFRPELPGDARAGLEAALQGSGLLDAWVLPDGTLVAGIDDVFLLGNDAATATTPSHLGQALQVTVDRNDLATRDFDAAALERALAQIGLGENAGEHWVASDGTWRLGPLRGHASKQSADYIGESTRAEHRRRQLTELRTRQDATRDALTQIESELAALADDRARATQELAAAPGDDSVLRAGFSLETATRAVADTLATSERAARAADQQRRARDEAVEAQMRDAADLRLSAWLGRLDALAEATHAYATALAALWPTARHWTAAAAQRSAVDAQVAEAEADWQSRTERREQASAAAEAARQRFATLEEMHGETVTVVLRKLEAAKTEVNRLKQELADNQRRQIAEAATHAKAESDKSVAEQHRGEHEAARRVAIASLQRMAEQRLLAEADANLKDIDAGEWSVAHAIEFVRHRLDPLLEEVDDAEASWRQRQDAIHHHIQELRDRLVAHGHQPDPHQFEDVVLVQCIFQGRAHTMSELRDAFAAEVANREQLLRAREQEIIENHLLAEVAVELAKLIRAADSWRVSANEELSARPTSAGVRFRFQWEPDAETGFEKMRPTLLRKGELWTPAERSALASFLQARIAAEQNADESGSWREHLTRALDYRRWHRFAIERQQDGQWRRLNRTTYGTGSGGEKALALTLPRFAAAAAHYRSAAPTAPRLVMLDEAFAGIDPTMRAQCMGVLTQFDLDVVMTSELEWGCYRTVPALAIYHLTTLPGLDAVAATRWIWNGHERRQEDTPLPPDAPADDGQTPDASAN